MVQVVATSGGWVGAVGTVGAYAMVSGQRLDANSLRFQAVNVVGAALLALSALTVHNWPSMMSNLVWMSFGVYALVRARSALRAAVAWRWRRLHDRTVLRLHRDDDPAGEGASEQVALAA
jgi:hypothetical protein